LQSSGDVDGVAGNQEFTSRGAARGDHLARVHADAKFKPLRFDPPLVPPAETVEHPLPRAHRPHSVILMRGWDTEDGHDGVPDELLDRSALSEDLLRHGCEEVRH
jgi:hypothetical protein